MTTDHEANTLYEGYTADYTGVVHFAASPRGQWFKRSRVRDHRYGYRNTRWTPCPAPAGRPLVYTGRKCRLPRSA